MSGLSFKRSKQFQLELLDLLNRYNHEVNNGIYEKERIRNTYRSDHWDLIVDDKRIQIYLGRDDNCDGQLFFSLVRELSELSVTNFGYHREKKLRRIGKLCSQYFQDNEEKFSHELEEELNLCFTTPWLGSPLGESLASRGARNRIETPDGDRLAEILHENYYDQRTYSYLPNCPQIIDCVIYRYGI
jgi:hypothetical protein